MLEFHENDVKIKKKKPNGGKTENNKSILHRYQNDSKGIFV